MLQAILVLYKEVITLPSADTSLHSRITDDPKYKTFFTDCISVIDKTYINVSVSPAEQPRYQNRKGQLTQNVLAACDFGIRFTYILAG
jgi:hypothetical protein